MGLPLDCVDLLLLRNTGEDISDFGLSYFIFSVLGLSVWSILQIEIVGLFDLVLLGQKLVSEVCLSFWSRKSIVHGAWSLMILCSIPFFLDCPAV